MVLSSRSDDDLSEKEGRAGPAGPQQQMALGDGIVAAIALVREYLPFRVTSACGRILCQSACKFAPSSASNYIAGRMTVDTAKDISHRPAVCAGLRSAGRDLYQSLQHGG